HDLVPMVAIRADTAAAVDFEPDVVLVEGDIRGDEYDPVLIQGHLPERIRWGNTTRDSVAKIFKQTGVGVIRAIIDPGAGSEATFVRSRSLRRAHSVASDRDPLDVAAELFGTWWTDASALGLVDANDQTLEGGRADESAAVTEAPPARARRALRWAGTGAIDTLKRWA
ncbi:hypothetical protein, partial [Ilumatobacter sp.]|uniref:hypothetical protein n=1 Tax=Ilumatobacter sp. TaxID=1967498 RepID=UPI003C57BC1B